MARSESDQEKIVSLFALVAPDLRGAACEIIRGDDDDGADKRESWAAGFFISSEPQPPAELVPLAVVPTSKALVVKRRLLPTPQVKPKTYAELKAEFEADAKPQPELEPEPKPEPSTALVPVSNELAASSDPGEAVKELNDKHAVIGNLASHDERRYPVNRINERWKQDKSYFAPLFAEINNGGAAAILYDLLNLDLDGWHPRERVPQTKALLDQKMLGMTGLEQWYVHLLSVGELPKPNPKNPRWVLSETLIEDTKNHGPRNKYITPEELAQFVKEMGCTHKSNGKKWGWIFPPLAEARAAWHARAGNTWEWLADIEDWGDKQRDDGFW